MTGRRAFAYGFVCGAFFLLGMCLGCTSVVVTQPSRIKSFLGWAYSVEPLQATPVASIPGVPSWAGPMWQPEAPSAFPWLAVLVVALLVSIPLLVWYWRGRAAALALVTAPVRVAKRLIPRRNQ